MTVAGPAATPAPTRHHRPRVAGAPISWGVCEVPGWGYQQAPDRVLAEMRDLGLAATEFGPPGFLPRAPADRAAALRSYGLGAVGGFLALVLHDADRDPLPAVAAELDAYAMTGAGVLVVAADSPGAGYDAHVQLDDRAWRRLLDRLQAVDDLAAARGVTTVLHPHAGTVVESWPDVERVLTGSSVPLCLDTGHLLVGGVDPVALARDAGDRVGHVHLKDVDARLADAVRSGSVDYSDAVRDGLYAPLGTGAVDLSGLLAALAAVGYDGWYVLEQDVRLGAEPPAGGGPVADVRTSLAALTRGLAGEAR